MERLRHPVVFNFLCLFDTLNISSSLHWTSSLCIVCIILEVLTTEKDSGSLTKFAHRNKITSSSIPPRHWTSLCCLSNEGANNHNYFGNPSILCMALSLISQDSQDGSKPLFFAPRMWIQHLAMLKSVIFFSPENDSTYLSTLFFILCIFT